jgi:hypothetical protein
VKDPGIRSYTYEVWRQGETFAKNFSFFIQAETSVQAVPLSVLDPVIYCREETL